MTTDIHARPREVLIAVLLAICALIVNVAAVLAWKEAYGEAWVLFLFTRIVVTAVYGVLFAFAYQGRGWVRYAYLVVMIIGVGRYAMADIGLLLNPFVLLSVMLSVLALVFWFLPNTNQWYQQQRISRTQKSSVASESE